MNGTAGITGWVGVDVSKKKLDVAYVDLAREGKVKEHVFVNDASGHRALTAWLQKLAPLQALAVCMEATGPYSEQAATALHDAGLRVSVINPMRVKGFAQGELVRNKNDRADAVLLVRFGSVMKPDAWTPAPKEVRALRAMVERLQSLKTMEQQERNRLEACQAAGEPVALQSSIETHICWLEDSIAALSRQINDHIDGHPQLRHDAELMRSIPGIGDATAARFLALAGDIRRFRSAKSLAAFLGVTPRQRQSGTSLRARTVISRAGNANLRSALYMPALVAQRFNPAIKAFAERLRASGKTPKAVVAASMHKLALIIFGVLRSGQPFNPQMAFSGLDRQDGI